jgi:hypothetical protein
MKFAALVAAGCLAVSLGQKSVPTKPDKEVECEGLEAATSCTYIDPSGKNQTGTCQVVTDVNSPECVLARVVRARVVGASAGSAGGWWWGGHKPCKQDFASDPLCTDGVLQYGCTDASSG